MASGAGEELRPATLKLLSDKSFDKRKLGAAEVEAMCRRLREGGNTRDAVTKLVTVLSEELALSPAPNSRKGGLIALASAAIGLGAEATCNALPSMLPAILKNFGDPEPRVRYYACESLFNVTKICRVAMLPFIGELFVGVCRLVGDADADVRNGAAIYDRLLKELREREAARFGELCPPCPLDLDDVRHCTTRCHFRPLFVTLL